jgi:hypothetical protein
MKIEDQVCSLDLAKRLKELGVKQESYFRHVRLFGSGENYQVWRIDGWDKHLPSSQLEQVEKMWLDGIPAFTVAELGELLPLIITHQQVNAAYPMPQHGEEKDEEWDKIEEARQAVRDELREVFTELETDCDEQFEDGMPYNIRIGFNDGKEVTYHQITDDWEYNYEVLRERADTEADARAKMLIYLLENNLIEKSVY